MLNWYYIEKAFANCSLSPVEIERIRARLVQLEGEEDEFSNDEREALISSVYENQHDRIMMGFNYNQTDIKNHLKKLK